MTFDNAARPPHAPVGRCPRPMWNDCGGRAVKPRPQLLSSPPPEYVIMSFVWNPTWTAPTPLISTFRCCPRRMRRPTIRSSKLDSAREWRQSFIAAPSPKIGGRGVDLHRRIHGCGRGDRGTACNNFRGLASARYGRKVRLKLGMWRPKRGPLKRSSSFFIARRHFGRRLKKPTSRDYERSRPLPFRRQLPPSSPPPARARSCASSNSSPPTSATATPAAPTIAGATR
jgi:hypothetical protein